MFLFYIQLCAVCFCLVQGNGKCGTNTIDKRIIGGEGVMKHEFPWQAAIRWRVGITKGEHVCGGSLIDPKFVLTAAHCFVHGTKLFYYNVTLGDHSSNSVGQHEQIKTIKKITVHPKYNNKTNDNDIALIELNTAVTINDNVNAICLPQFFDLEFPGTVCTITGWGRTLENKVAASNVLQKVNVPVINYGVCNHDRSYQGKLTGNMFCAGYANGSADTCKGDSGGPLQCKSKTKGMWLLHGVTSWGDGCGTKHKYGVYTVVRHYLYWINNNMRPSTPPQPKSPPVPPQQKSPPVPPQPKSPPVPQQPKSPPVPPQPKSPPISPQPKSPLVPPQPKLPPISPQPKSPPISPPISPQPKSPLVPPQPKSPGTKRPFTKKRKHLPFSNEPRH